MYAAGVRLQVRTFFKVTSLLLVIFAAAILRHAVNEFEEVGWLPPLIEHIWNTASWLPASSGIGSLLQLLVGYTEEPSLLQVIVYFGYLLVVGVALLRPTPVRPVEPQVVAARVPAPNHEVADAAALPSELGDAAPTRNQMPTGVVSLTK
jgi:high-affinity Fe2+/Pb2+ permease